MRMMTRFTLLLAMFSTLAACVGMPTGQTTEPVSDKAVVLALVDTAQTELSVGRPDAAAAALERALRIEPRNPILWHELAKARLHQNRYAQAAALAAKSNALPAAGNALKAANWRIIGEVRARQGDEPGARAAFAQADALERQ